MPFRAPPRAAPAIAAALLVVLVAAILLLVTRRPARESGSAPAISTPAPAPPSVMAAPPPPPPALFVAEDPQTARTSNAAVPVAPGKPRPAAPFRFAGAEFDRAAARACLAAAEWYEAGDDAPGEQAVAQVVLNRLRHPAFPKTVCGVVFQGSERHTGCQFTFTCDGSLARTPAAAAWRRASDIAERAISGRVMNAVGTATHYHADYVVPRWRGELEKIALVGPHIFYRWPGWWGSPGALSGRLQPGEPLNPRVAVLAGIAPDAPAAPAAPAAPGDPQHPAAAVLPTAVPGPTVVRLRDEEGAQFLLQLNPAAPQGFAAVAVDLCGARTTCTVMGWTTAGEVPRAFPVTPAEMRSLAFLYRRTAGTSVPQSVWDCDRFVRPVPTQCFLTAAN